MADKNNKISGNSILYANLKGIPDARRKEIAKKTDLLLVDVIKSGADAEVMWRAAKELNSLKPKERQLVLLNLMCRNVSLINNLYNRRQDERELKKAYA